MPDPDRGLRVAPAVWLGYIDYGNANVADHVDHTAMYIQGHWNINRRKRTTYLKLKSCSNTIIE